MHRSIQRQSLVWLTFGLSLVVLCARGQLTVSNSTTLTVTLAGSNVLLRADFATTNGAFTLLQGARPDALTLPACSCQISNQIVDLGWVPASGSAQWTLTNAAASTRFFRLELQPVLTRGRALVFKDGPIDWEATHALGPLTNGSPVIYNEPVEVWLDHLGSYDTNGVLVGSNDGMLSGFYGSARITSIGQLYPTFDHIPNLAPLVSQSNDFRIDYTGVANGLPRESIIWASAVAFYWAIDDYRTRFFNAAFVNELNLPPNLASNLLQRQFRPDLDMLTNFSGPIHLERPVFYAEEMPSPAFPFRFEPRQNAYGVSARSREATQPGATSIPLSLMFDYSDVVADYAGLVSFWILGVNTGFPSDGFWGGNGWQNNVLPPINDGISAWVAYRVSGKAEIYRHYAFAVRVWENRPCGGTNQVCDRGRNVRNVMMHDEGTLNGDGLFPFRVYPSAITDAEGPLGSDWAALYFGAIFYDMANEAGLGVHKADLLFWKMFSLITDTNSFTQFTMRDFGAKVLEATRALWPDGRYTNDVADVLTSRGVPVNGVNSFRANLPVAIGSFPETLEVSSVNGFGSSHPEVNPSGSSTYGSHSFALNGYLHPDTNASYVAYQFYKHSKYGPCDKLALTDGTFTTTSSAPFAWHYNNDGTFYLELDDRHLGNITLLLPGRAVRWIRSKQHCPDEATASYAEDVRPFGFRVIQATSDGFSFTAAALSETTTNKTYALTIVDPSLATLGPASYAWTVTNHLGTATSMTGTNAFFTVTKDEPFTLNIERTRSGVTNTLTLRERGNDLDRNGGNAFVRNLVP